MFLAAPKIVSSFTDGSWEKDTTFGATRIFFFDPSYFVTALVTTASLYILHYSSLKFCLLT